MSDASPYIPKATVEDVSALEARIDAIEPQQDEEGIVKGIEATTPVNVTDGLSATIATQIVELRDVRKELEQALLRIKAIEDEVEETDLGTVDDEPWNPHPHIHAGEGVAMTDEGENQTLMAPERIDQWYLSETCDGTALIVGLDEEVERKRVTHGSWTGGCYYLFYDRQIIKNGKIFKIYENCSALQFCAEPCVELVDPECA